MTVVVPKPGIFSDLVHPYINVQNRKETTSVAMKLGHEKQTKTESCGEDEKELTIFSRARSTPILPKRTWNGEET